MTTKTPGQVAYEKREDSEPFECYAPWHMLKPAIRDRWENIAQAVVQHHEERREQTQRRSGRTTRMLLDAYYALMETQDPRPVVVVGGNARQADLLFRIFSNRILGENPRWCKTDHKLGFFDLSCPTRTIEFITYAELIGDTGNSLEWQVNNSRSGGRRTNRLVFEDHAAKEIYDRRNDNMRPRVEQAPPFMPPISDVLLTLLTTDPRTGEKYPSRHTTDQPAKEQ